MAVYNRQPRWDIYEAVILLDGYLESLRGNQPKIRIVRRVSADLRQMAKNRNIEIDEIYRNENGISYQIQSMDSAYKGRKVYVPATKLFTETVKLYHTNIDEYREILEKAKRMIVSKVSNRAEFVAWAASVLPIRRLKWLEKNIRKIEQFAIASGLISGSIFEVNDLEILKAIYKASMRDNSFQFKNRKFIKNINRDFNTYIKFISLTSERLNPVMRQELLKQPNSVMRHEPLKNECSVQILDARKGGDFLVVDFESGASMEFTKPISVSFFGKELAKISSWRDVYVSVISLLYEKYPDMFDSISSFFNRTKVTFGTAVDAGYMFAPRKITEKLYVETNLSAEQIIGRIKILLSMCSVPFITLKIIYIKRNATKSKKQEILKNKRSIKLADTRKGSGFLVVDFESGASMEFTKPISVSFFGTELAKISTWKDVYVSVVSALYEKYPDMFDSISSFFNRIKLTFGTAVDARYMSAPRKITEELYVETKYSAKDIIGRIKILLSMCSVPFSTLKIIYIKHNATKSKKQEILKNKRAIKHADTRKGSGFLVVDFKSGASMEFTKPISVSFFGAELAKISTWKDVYVGVVSALYEKYPDAFDSISSFFNRTRLTFGTAADAGYMSAPGKITEKLYVETKYDAKTIIGRIKILLSKCGVPCNELKIVYEKKGATKSKKQEILKNKRAIKPLDIRKSSDFFVVDFESRAEASMEFTKPISVSFFGMELAKTSSWKDVYASVVSVLYEKYPDAFDSISSFFNRIKLTFGTAVDVRYMSAPRKITEELYVETKYSAKNIIGRIKILLSKCGVPCNELKIVYEKKNATKLKEQGILKNKSFIKPDESSIKSADAVSFYEFLRNSGKLADRTCSNYVASIRSVEQYAANNGYTFCSLYDEKKETVLAIVSELYSDTEFIRYNKEQHNRFSAAINKFLLFIDAKFSAKECNSLYPDHRQNFASVKVNSDIVAVLKQYYEYGFKYNSIREIMRFRNFADAMGIILPQEDEILKTSILSSGIIIDDKVYCASNDMAQELQYMVEGVFSSGAGVIYYESLFENEREWMKINMIISPDMLKEYLKKFITGCSFSKKFFVKGNHKTEKEVIVDELKRVWGTSPTKNIHAMHDSLPYIPLNNIWRVISGNNLFVSTSEGEYLFVDRFHVTEDEENDILNFVEGACKNNGFASLGDIPLGDIEEENYELTQNVIYNAIYRKVLSGKYHLKGKILTKEKNDIDAVTLLKRNIRDRDECIFDEIADMVVELTGDSNRQYAFQALYDEMVRISENRFVANRFVNFDVDVIDAVLSGFITDNFRAIRDVTTFAMFPFCGQSWNHYLLESFCYKYSRKYSLYVIRFNDKNVGIIAEKDYNKGYSEMLAIALARTNIELSPEIIGPYLFNAGYIIKSKYANLDKIAQRAIELRKER